jgi:hypothetical protein
MTETQTRLFYSESHAREAPTFSADVTIRNDAGDVEKVECKIYTQEIIDDIRRNSFPGSELVWSGPALDVHNRKKIAGPVNESLTRVSRTREPDQYGQPPSPA